MLRRCERDRCPRCGGKMDVVVSGNLIFHSCSNESCGYIRSDLYLPSNPLPVPVEEVITFLRNERREAEQSSSTIGSGRTIKQYTTGDGLGIIAELVTEKEWTQESIILPLNVAKIN